MECNNFEDMFFKRMVQLRLEKKISARDMSLSLGQSESYINKIENRKAFPSMMGFFYICDFFNITPMEFFDFNTTSPTTNDLLSEKIKLLCPEVQKHIIEIIDDITG